MHRMMCACMDVWKQATAGVFCACLSGPFFSWSLYSGPSLRTLRKMLRWVQHPSLCTATTRTSCLHTLTKMRQQVCTPHTPDNQITFDFYTLQRAIASFFFLQRWYDLLTIYSPLFTVSARTGALRICERHRINGGKIIRRRFVESARGERKRYNMHLIR